MKRVHSFRGAIATAIFLAVILFSAVFAVSFAYWNVAGSTTTTASANGNNIGLFYVDYDKPFVGEPTDQISAKSVKVIFLDGKTVAFEADNYDGDVYLHIWQSSTNTTTWPGVQLTGGEIRVNWELSSTKGIIFNNDAGNQSGDDTLFYNTVFINDSAVGALADKTLYNVDLEDLGMWTSDTQSFDTGLVKKTTGSVALYGDAELTVRKVFTDEVNTYRNYVCVRRTKQYESNGSVTNSEPSYAFVEFAATAENAADLSATVTSFTVTRVHTDADGLPRSGSHNMRVYGSPVGKTLGDITGNTYIVLDFADGEDMYYAMNVVITTDTNVTYTLTATATYADTHTYKAANSYYLGFDDFAMREPVYAGAVESDDYVDASVTLTLTTGQSFKLYSTGSGTGDSIAAAKYYGVDSKSVGYYDPNVLFYPSSIAENFALPTGDGGDDAKVTVNKSGKYRIRYVGSVRSGFGAVDKTVERVEITLVDHATDEDDMDVETTAAGLYLVGTFCDNVTYEGLKLEPSQDYIGVYEITSHILESVHSYNVAYRAEDGGKLVGFDTQEVSQALPSGADGITVTFDALNNAYNAQMPNHRFIVNFGDISDKVEGLELTLRYRKELSSIQLAENLKQSTFRGFNNTKDVFDGKYYADLTDDGIASVTVKATSETKRHNSFDINTITVRRVCEFKDKSYVIEYSELVGNIPDMRNWTGNVTAYANGALSANAIPFGLNLKTISSGYAIVYNDRNSNFSYNNRYIPMHMSDDNDWDYTVDLDTRAGGEYNSLIGKDFMIFHNGNAMSQDLDDGIIRITHKENTYTYSVIDHAKAQGKFVIKIRKSYYDPTNSRFTDNVNIAFVAGAAIDEKPIDLSKLDTQADNSAISGYYIFGQFSGWEVYSSNIMTETGLIGVYTVTLDSVITTEDLGDVVGVKPGKYKIVYIPKTGAPVYYGATDGKVTVNSGNDNMEITSETFCFDAFNATAGAATTSVYIDSTYAQRHYRVVYHNTVGHQNVKLQYWDDEKGSVACWTDSGLGSLLAPPAMTAVVSANSDYNDYYYYDVVSDYKYNGAYLNLTNIAVYYGANISSNEFTPDFISTDGTGERSYIITYVGGKWNGEEYFSVKWTNAEFVEPTQVDNEIHLHKLGNGEHWVMQYDIVKRFRDEDFEYGNWWYFGAYVGGNRQLVGVEMADPDVKGGWYPSVNVYGHIYAASTGYSEREYVLLSLEAINMLNNASETNPVTVLFVRNGDFVKVFLSDANTSMLYLGTVSLERFRTTESDKYTYTDDFGYGWRHDCTNIENPDESEAPGKAPGSDSGETGGTGGTTEPVDPEETQTPSGGAEDNETANPDNTEGTESAVTDPTQSDTVTKSATADNTQPVGPDNLVFGNPVISNIKYAIGEDAVKAVLRQYAVHISKTDCTTVEENYYIGDFVDLVADPAVDGMAFDHFVVDGQSLGKGADNKAVTSFTATKSLHVVRAVYVNVSRIVIAEHASYQKIASDGKFVLPQAVVQDAQGNVLDEYKITATVENSWGGGYTVTNGEAYIPYEGSVRLKITYTAAGLVGTNTATTYVTVQRSGDMTTVFAPELTSIDLTSMRDGTGTVEFDSTVRHGDDQGSIKIRPDGAEFGLVIEDFDYREYDYIKFYVYVDTVTASTQAGVYWYGDTALTAGQWTELKIATDGGSQWGKFTYYDNNGAGSTNRMGHIVLRLMNANGITVWISSVKAYKDGAETYSSNATKDSLNTGVGGGSGAGTGSGAQPMLYLYSSDFDDSEKRRREKLLRDGAECE